AHGRVEDGEGQSRQHPQLKIAGVEFALDGLERRGEHLRPIDGVHHVANGQHAEHVVPVGRGRQQAACRLDVRTRSGRGCRNFSLRSLPTSLQTSNLELRYALDYDQMPKPLRSNFEPGSTRDAVRRAQWKALGLTDEDLLKPKIALVNSSSELAIC